MPNRSYSPALCGGSSAPEAGSFLFFSSRKHSPGRRDGYDKGVCDLVRMGVGMGHSRAAELTIHDLRNGLSATMNSSA